MNKEYIFKSERLGFRDWNDHDLDEFSKLNSDMNVMEHFPKPLTKEESYDFIQRLKNTIERKKSIILQPKYLKLENLLVL